MKKNWIIGSLVLGLLWMPAGLAAQEPQDETEAQEPQTAVEEETAPENEAAAAPHELTEKELYERLVQVTDKVAEGNEAYQEKRYQDALRCYEDAAALDSTSFIAHYNRAVAMYQLDRFQEAGQVLDGLMEAPEMESVKGDFFFNRGNCALGQQDYARAMESFKQTLLQDPTDEAARESYAYAKAKLKDQQNQQNQDQNKDNKDNQDQNKDQNKDQQDQNKDQQDQNKDQNQDQNKDQQNQNQQQNQQDQNQQQNPQGQQGQQPKMSQQAAQQMLQAIQAQEKKTQDKVNKKKAAALAAQKKQKTKNW